MNIKNKWCVFIIVVENKIYIYKNMEEIHCKGDRPILFYFYGAR